METGRNFTPRFDSIDPTICLNAKLRRLHRLLNGVYQARIRPYGLRGSMLSILFIIGKSPRVLQKDLSERLVLDESTISRDIGRLMKEGWVGRRASKDDGRSYDLFVTDSGYQLLEEVTPVWIELQQSVERLLGQHLIKHIDIISQAIEAGANQLQNK